MKFRIVTSLLLLLCNKSFAEDYYVKLLQTTKDDGVPGEHCLILSEETIQRFKGYKSNSPKALYVSSKAAVSSPADAQIRNLPNSADRVVEIYARQKSVIQAHLQFVCKTTSHVTPMQLKSSGKEPEVVKLVDGGDQGNRIDVVFMGDGYTATERDEFFDDMRRLTVEMFEGVTFRSYLPVFNIWAIYVESVTSGIGYNGPIDTPFQLYRESGELRAIYPGDANNARQTCLLTGTSGCDYPSIIGNDDFYGGLGGEFVISTRSNRTGTTVLRHEMGHNFINVGEEYDNGYVYSGVNAASSVESLGWSHWLSGEKTEERAIYRITEYPWQDLSQSSVEYEFTSDGLYSRWYLLVSVSAAGEEDSLEFLLDGEVLPWKTAGFDDREFYNWYGDAGFTTGRHTFSVRSKTPSTNPSVPRMICSITLHELGNEDEFHADNTYVSAYPTWDVNGRKTFRPTNAGCLMRNMTHAALCNICKEGMWYEFLQRISLIDAVRVVADPENTEVMIVTVETLKLGQLRDPAFPVSGELLEVRWSLNGEEVEAFRDQFEISAVQGSGSWTVQVTFVTSEVRADPNALLTDSNSFTV